jgi:hypothetical protein
MLKTLQHTGQATEEGSALQALLFLSTFKQNN